MAEDMLPEARRIINGGEFYGSAASHMHTHFSININIMSVYHHDTLILIQNAQMGIHTSLERLV